MLSYTDIQEIVAHKEKEKSNLELKSFRLFYNDQSKSDRKEQLQDLAGDITSLANRYGGKIIVGINNDGTYDGKFEGNIDSVKRDIHNVCHDIISPVIECDTEFLECDNYDFLIVYVPKRKGIPHAVVPSRNDINIKSRIYYTRTSHGKKLITDAQLEWLFKSQEDPVFSSEFRVKLEFNKQVNLIGGNIPWGSYHINNWLSYLSVDDRKRLMEENNTFHQFFVELFPFFILRNLSESFAFSWYIGFHEQFERMSSGPKRTTIPVKSIPVQISEIPFADASVIDTLSWNFKEVLNRQFRLHKTIQVPPDTKAKIVYENDSSSGKIIFQNPAFNFEIGVAMLSAGAGLHPKNPYYQAWQETDLISAQDFAMKNHFFFDGAGFTYATFEFPELYIEEYNRYFQYYESLKQVFEYNWSYDKIMANILPQRIFVLEHKIETILQLLQNQQ